MEKNKKNLKKLISLWLDGKTSGAIVPRINHPQKLTPANLFIYLYEHLDNYIPSPNDELSIELYPAILEILKNVESGELKKFGGFWTNKDLQKAFIKSWDIKLYNFNAITDERNEIKSKQLIDLPILKIELEKKQ